MIRFFLTVIGAILVSNISFAQDSKRTHALDSLTVSATLELQRLKQESEMWNKLQAERVREYGLRNNVPVEFRDYNGNLVVLIGVSETGEPQYIASDNAGAATTTGVGSLRPSGILGLNLEGEEPPSPVIIVLDGLFNESGNTMPPSL